MILVSGCLLGISCRYDGTSHPCENLQDFIRGQGPAVPVCPEQLGGLPTPRPPAALVGGDGFDVLAGRARVIRVRDGVDVTAAFLAGAKECVRLVKLLKLDRAVMKSRSPSCGLGRLTGVAAAALLMEGLDLIEI